MSTDAGTLGRCGTRRLRWIADDPDPATRAELQRVLAAAMVGTAGRGRRAGRPDVRAAAVRHRRAARAGAGRPGRDERGRGAPGHGRAGRLAGRPGRRPRRHGRGRPGRPARLGGVRRRGGRGAGRGRVRRAGAARRRCRRRCWRSRCASSARWPGCRSPRRTTRRRTTATRSTWPTAPSSPRRPTPRSRPRSRAAPAAVAVPIGRSGRVRRGRHRVLPGPGRAAAARHGARTLRVALTPLHGVGGATARARRCTAPGSPTCTWSASQAEPDPDFPTVAFPNPEEPGAADALLAARPRWTPTWRSPWTRTPTAARWRARIRTAAGGC